ncbi:CapA family protein [Caldalkalibacillus salinus]|uniref:CapA family protein n=1 Tax=Caldalkalibacillus salinus TaxID=2803787 RepID=UPI00192163E8|nr:CapA family protein [Caldalkalibacillus salinus]
MVDNNWINIILSRGLRLTGVFLTLTLLAGCVFLDYIPWLQPEEVTQEIEETASDTVLRLAFAGDTMGAGKVAPILEEQGYMYPFEEARPYFEESDLAMVNLETAMSDRGDAEDKAYAFRTHPDFVKGLDWAGIDLVSVANNHSLDYGVVAFLDTLDELQQHEIGYVGGGVNAEEAYREQTYEVNGQTVAFLGFSRVLPDVSWYAREDQPGLASGYQEERIYQGIRQASASADLTVVYIHWGNEMELEASDDQRRIAHQMVEEGADVVIGAHPHVLQELEWHQGKLIAYSLGNFVFTMSHEDIGRQTAILQLEIDAEGGQKATVSPFRIRHGAVWEAKGEEREEILRRLQTISTTGEWQDHVFYPR